MIEGRPFPITTIIFSYVDITHKIGRLPLPFDPIPRDLRARWLYYYSEHQIVYMDCYECEEHGPFLK